MTRAAMPLYHRKRWFHQYGWFCVVLGCGGALYFHAMKQKELMYREMKAQFLQLEKDKAAASAMHKELVLQIQSQSDPAWVEMVLKRNLGLVREGQVKVYFHNTP